MIETIADNWSTHRTKLNELDEKQLKELIAYELKGRARKTVIVLAHQRQSRLRTERERDRLIERVEKRQEKLNGARKER